MHMQAQWVHLQLHTAIDLDDLRSQKRQARLAPTHRPQSSSFFLGLYLESYEVIPNRNYLGAHG